MAVRSISISYGYGILQLHSLSALLVNLPSTMNDAIITARKRSLPRLCFYTCLSVHRGFCSQGVCSRGVCSWGVPGPGMCLVRGVSAPGGACSEGGSPGKHPRPPCSSVYMYTGPYESGRIITDLNMAGTCVCCVGDKREW